MGDIANMMISGKICESCTTPLDPDKPLNDEGMPSYCSVSCAKERGADWWIEVNNNQQ